MKTKFSVAALTAVSVMLSGYNYAADFPEQTVGTSPWG